MEWLIYGLIIIALLGIVFYFYTRGRTYEVTRIKKPLLTPREQDFYHELKKHISTVNIFPQQVMIKIIPETNSKYNLIKWCIVDFAIVDASTCTTLVIEVDDKSHMTPQSKQKDYLVGEALREEGIKLIRFNGKITPDRVASALRA